MIRLESHVGGRWVAGSAAGRPFVDPTTGEVLGHVDSTGVDCIAALQYAREVGGPALAALSFEARGALLGAIGDVLAAVHDVEVFGPVVTVIAYDGTGEAATLAARGEGSLAASVYADDPADAAVLVAALAPLHGRVLAVDTVVGRGHTGHAIVMPMCVHGGPGRAGGGEELGGLRGLRFYMQRTAIQGSPAMLDALTKDAVTVAL